MNVTRFYGREQVPTYMLLQSLANLIHRKLFPNGSLGFQFAELCRKIAYNIVDDRMYLSSYIVTKIISFFYLIEYQSTRHFITVQIEK